MTDKEISKMLKKRQPEVFEYLMNQYNKLLWLVAGNVLEKVGTKEDVEDCISDVYIKLLNNPNIYNYKKGSIKSLLVKMTRNKALDKYRSITNKNIIVLDEYISDDFDVSEQVLNIEINQMLIDSVNKLDDKSREIIIRRYIFDEKPKMISEKMCIQTKTIENKLYQSKLKLKKILEDGGYEYGKE